MEVPKGIVQEMPPEKPPDDSPPPLDSGRNVNGTFKAGHAKTGGGKLGSRSKATLMLEATAQAIMPLPAPRLLTVRVLRPPMRKSPSRMRRSVWPRG
jgi:hypothetical protein